MTLTDEPTAMATGTATMTMIEAIRHTLEAELARDERVIVFGEDVGRNGGVFRATDGLAARFGSNRVVDMPLAEAVIVGAAVGLAASGMRPVPEIQFLPFAWQAFHQIVGQVARLRWRSGGSFSVPITIRAPYGGGVRTPEFHSEALEAQFASSPGLKIIAPANAADAKGLLAASIRCDDPVLFLEPLKGYRQISGAVPLGEHVIELGRAAIVESGTDITVIAWSTPVEVCRRAARRLAEEDHLSVEVIDLRSIVPFDAETVVASVCRTGRAVVVSEAPFTAGFASEVSATIAEEAFWSLEAPVARVTGFDVPYPVGMLEDFFVPDVDRVCDAVRRVCAIAP